MSEQAKPVAWMTEAPDGSPMLWPTREEAASYCAEDESPVPLYAARQPLTAEQIWFAVGNALDDSMVKLRDVLPLARAIERAHGIGGAV